MHCDSQHSFCLLGWCAALNLQSDMNPSSLTLVCSYLYTFTLTLPDSVSIYASFPDAAAATGERLCSQLPVQLSVSSAQLNTCSQCTECTVAQCSVLTASCRQPVSAALHACQVSQKHAWKHQTLFLPGNVYGILPPSHARSASIILMLLHQCVAYGMFIMPGEVCVPQSCSSCCCITSLLQLSPCPRCFVYGLSIMPGNFPRAGFREWLIGSSVG